MPTLQKRIPIDETIDGHRLTGHLDLSLNLQAPVVEPPPVKWELAVTPGNTVQSVIDQAKRGDTILIPDGVYYETLTVRTPGIRLLTENPGGAVLSGLWQEAFEGTLKWRHVRKGIYSAASRGTPFIGAYRPKGGVDRMLFHYNDLRALESSEVTTKKGTYNKPEYGFTEKDGLIYLRLPGRADPNGQSIELCTSFSKPLIQLENAANVTIDGLAVAGAGNTDAIVSDRGSHHLHVTNVVSTHNRRMAAVADNALVEWCDYSFPGMYAFVDDLIDLNGEGSGVVFDLVKNYYGSGSNAYLEGGICEQTVIRDSRGKIIGGRSSKNCEFRFNRIHQVFDGMRLGAFHESRAHHNIFNYCYDDAIELEHWRKSSPTSKNEVYENLVLNSHASAFSHADPTGGGMDGPHFVYRNVVWITDRKHAHPPYIIKNRKLKPSTKIYYWNNILMNLPGVNGGWGSTNQIWWRNDGKNEQRPENITMRNNILVMPGGMSLGGAPDSNGNVLINDIDFAPARGPKGVYAGESIADAGFVDPDSLDFSLNADSPAVGLGVPLEAWWPKNDSFAGHDQDAGVFPHGQAMPRNWPRTIGLAFARRVA